MKENILLSKTFAFAIRVVNLCRYLREHRSEYVLSKQLLRCGTSIGANAEEANSGQSKKDFISKLQISLKEAKETRYWLRLLKETDYLTTAEFESMHQDVNEILQLLTSILKTAKQEVKE